MSYVTDFCDSIGLNDAVRRWLRNNEGDELREDIISALMDALDDDCRPAHRVRLQSLITKLHLRPTFR